MNEHWAIVSALVGQFIALAGLILAGMKIALNGLDRRFSDYERLRTEGAAHWRELLNARDQRLETLTHQIIAGVSEHGDLRTAIEIRGREIAELRLEVARDYVTRDLWVEQFGSIQIKLDKIKERLDARDN